MLFKVLSSNTEVDTRATWYLSIYIDMSRPDARNALSVVHSVNGSVAPSDKDTDNSHTVA